MEVITLFHLCVYYCHHLLFFVFHPKYGVILLILSLSDLFPRWTLTVPFVWTSVIVQGSGSNGLLLLRSIPSFRNSTSHRPCCRNPFLLYFASGITISLMLPAFPFLFQSARTGMLNITSLPNSAVPGEALRTVWWVERTAQAVFVRKSAILLSFTELDISTSAIRSIPMIFWCICPRMALGCGFLTEVYLRLRPLQFV